MFRQHDISRKKIYTDLHRYFEINLFVTLRTRGGFMPPPPLGPLPFFQSTFFPVDFSSNHWCSSYILDPKWPRMHHFTHRFSKYSKGGPPDPTSWQNKSIFSPVAPLTNSWIRPWGLICTRVNVMTKCMASAWNTCVSNCTKCTKC